MIRIAATAGDPTSIGPEVAERAILDFFKSLPKRSPVAIDLYAPRSVFSKKLFALESSGQIKILGSHTSAFTPGKPGLKSSREALANLEAATEACLKNQALALVTGPLDKSKCAKVLPGFSGHTEYLQNRAGGSPVTMMLKSSHLAVSLVTTHIALKDVSKNLTREKIIRAAVHTNKYFSRFRRNPRVAVLALNPHASDHGLFGDEEKKVISPAIAKLKSMGLHVSGPHPADSVFHDAKKYDAFIAMYHDQGLIPLKMTGFFEAVNITLGLPFLRTSVDHGTAFDIAGQKKASYESYANALKDAYLWASLRT